MKKRLTDANSLLIDFIIQNMDKLYIGAILVLSVLIRYKFFRFESPDMHWYLLDWMREIMDNGGLASLREPIGNYNVPYMTVLTIIAAFWRADADRMLMVKLFSTFFDYFLAVLVWLVLRKYRDDRTAALGAAAILMNPIILLNSAFWGQCDIIYVTFVILSLLFCIKEKWFLTFLCFGIGFAFKLQTVFFLPVLVLCWVIKRFHFLYFLLIPIPNLILSLPAVFMGRPVTEILGIYFEQTTAYPEMVKNYPGVHFIFRGDYKDLYWASILFTVFVIGSGMFYYLKSRIYSNKNLMAFSVWCIWSCVLFLPAMHERYGLAMEVLFLLYVLLYKKDFAVCAGVYFCILCVYSSYLFQVEPWNKIYTSVINLFLYLYFTWKFFRTDLRAQGVGPQKTLTNGREA